jgi:hypothetical protein
MKFAQIIIGAAGAGKVCQSKQTAKTKEKEN